MLPFLVCVACGDNHHAPRLVWDVGEEPPAYGRAPFPTDAVREGPKLGVVNGFDRFIHLDTTADRVAAHLAALDGFGLRPTVEFFIQGAIDPETIPETSDQLTDSVFVLEVDPDTAEKGAPIKFDWRYDKERGVVVGSPATGVQLREGTRYAAVITKDVIDKQLLALYPSIDLGLLGADQDVPERWRTTSEAYQELRTLPELEDRIAGLAVFTTQFATDTLRKARNAIANTSVIDAPTLAFPDPALIFDSPSELDALLGVATRETSGPRDGLEKWGGDNPTGIAHDHVALVATGTITIGQFIGPDTGTNGPEDETFQLGGSGVPVLQSTQSIPITFVLPEGAMPANGFPVIVFGHGLGGSRHDMLRIAEPLAAQGYALVAIDMWNHGSRYNPTDVANNFGGKTGFTGNRTLRDGFGDADGTASYIDFFEELQNFSAIRDSIRQSALDTSRVAMLIRAKPSLAALAGIGFTPTLDPAKVAYLGESFGTIVGVDLAAIEPSIGLYVLDVPGGGLLDFILPYSAKVGDLARTADLYRTEGTLDRFHPLVGVLQAIFDGADSLTYARHVLRDRLVIENNFLEPRHVVALEVLRDEVMPNQATEALARALGLHVLRPNLAPPAGMLQLEAPGGANVAAQTAVLVQYEPATHADNWAAERGQIAYVPGYPHDGDDPYPMLAKPITIAEPLYETWTQVVEILSTYFDGMAPRVPSTKAPVADFDGDGKPDSADPDPDDPDK